MRGSSRLRLFPLVFILLHFLRSAARILDVVPRNVEKDGLDGHERQLGWVLDDILQVNTACGILAQPIYEGHRGVHVRRGVARVLEVDQSTITLDLTVEEGLERLGHARGDLDIERRVGGGLRGGGEVLRGSLGKGVGMVKEGEGVNGVLGEGVRTGYGEGPVECMSAEFSLVVRWGYKGLTSKR